MLAWAAAVVRAWTRLYTWRLPPAVRDARRAEIDSDLWEFDHEPGRRGGIVPALHVLLRLLAGVPDDLFWRREQGTAAGRPARVVMMLAAAAAIAVVVVSVWVLDVLRPLELPTPPAVRSLPARPPPPPPPSPPPPARPAR